MGSDPDWSLVCVPVVLGTLLPNPPTFLPLEPRPAICAEDFLPNMVFWSVVNIACLDYKIYDSRARLPSSLSSLFLRAVKSFE